MVGTAACVLAGCAQLPELDAARRQVEQSLQRIGGDGVAIAELPPARPPTARRQGDTFVYGRSNVHRVERAAAQRVHWTAGNRERFISGPHFFVPALQLQLQHDGTELRSRIDGRPQDLWPLQRGRSVQFTETRELRSAGAAASSRQYRWECEVKGSYRVSVPAGDFDTLRVQCLAYQPYVPVAVQRIVWDYAPSLGHYVRRSWFDGPQRPQEMLLSAAIPGALATERRIARVLQRLQAQ